MDRYDLAIAGGGTLPALLALMLARARPRLRILLAASEPRLPGEGLELLLPRRLAPGAASAIEPFVTGEWSGFHVVRGGRSRLIEEAAVLLDPVQLWIDLAERLGPRAIAAGCGDCTWADGVLAWPGAAALAADLIDLRGHAAAASPSQIIAGASGALDELQLPVLADFDAGGGSFACLQHVPLGGGRVAVRRLRTGEEGWLPREIRPGAQTDNYALLEALASHLA